MRKVIVLLFAMSFIVGAGLAYAAPNVASLTNRGSVLYFAKIDTSAGAETYLKFSNDAALPVTVKCYWVKVAAGGLDVVPDCNLSEVQKAKLPPKQTPADFAIDLTKNQPVMIKASTGESDAGDPIGITAQPFGVGNVGYLVCWAVNENDYQINWNFLNGEAIVVTPTNAYEYAAWTLGARVGSQGTVVGTPGIIEFDGVKYDAMPLYTVFTFPAAGFDGFVDLDLTMVQGSQNFNTMSTEHHVTRANFALWNENETPFSNISTCTWCYRDVLLYAAVSPNFGIGALNSSVGRFRLQGKASSTCLPALTQHQIDYCMPAGTNFSTYATGLLPVALQTYALPYVTVNTPGTAQTLSTDKITYTPFQ